MRIEVKQTIHPSGGITVFVLEHDSKSYMAEYLHIEVVDMAMSRSYLIREIVRELEATLRFNLEQPLADS